MPRNKIENEEIERRILEVLDRRMFSTSINKVAELLKEWYDIKISPQVVKRYLLKLTKEDKIIKKNG